MVVYAIYFDGQPHPTKDKLPLLFAEKAQATDFLKSKRQEIEGSGGQVTDCVEFTDEMYKYIYKYLDNKPEGYYAHHIYRVVEIPVEGMNE